LLKLLVVKFRLLTKQQHTNQKELVKKDIQKCFTKALHSHTTTNDESAKQLKTSSQKATLLSTKLHWHRKLLIAK